MRECCGITGIFIGIGQCEGSVSSLWVSMPPVTCSRFFPCVSAKGVFYVPLPAEFVRRLTALLVLAPTLDIWAIAIYGVEFVLWMGVFACGAYYNLIPWMIRKLDGGALSPPAEIELRLEHAPIPSADSQLRNRSVPVYLHRLSSSTSVFRTPSGADVVCRGSSIVSMHDSS